MRAGPATPHHHRRRTTRPRHDRQGMPARATRSPPPAPTGTRQDGDSEPQRHTITFVRNSRHAPPESRPQVQPHQRPPPGHVLEHGGLAVQARSHPHHPAEGQGTAPRRGAADHPGQDRRRGEPPPRLRAPARQGSGGHPVHHPGPALRAASGWLHAHPQVRLPCRRQRADGVRRAGRSPAGRRVLATASGMSKGPGTSRGFSFAPRAR